MLTLNPPDPNIDSLELEHSILNQLVGQYGRCITPLKPVGLIDLDGRKLEGSAEEGLLPVGTLVQVVQVRGNRVSVRRAELPAFDEIDG